MADPLEPHDIARRTFDVARRGYEQQEVRGFLHEVSALLERVQRSEQELRERVERAESKLGATQQPDEALLLEVLGEETTRVLTSAREAAAEIRTKAEEAAARIIAEATAEAAEIRGGAVRDADALMAETKRESEATLEAARTELDRRSAEAADAAARIRGEGEAAAAALRSEGQAELARARAEGEAAVEAARQEGRAMVAEAQAVRERVLRDLAVRRKRARQQVEKLNAGRERLLEAYEVVRRTVGEATDELTTSLSDARLAADAAARRIDEEPEPTLEQLDEEVANAGLVDLPIADVDHDHDEHEDEEEGHGPFSGEVPAVETAVAPADGADQGSAAAAPSDSPADRPVALDERRNRKRRRRGGFEGLPPGELTVLQPPSEDEGVRILADPAAPAEDAGPASPAEPASGGPADVSEDATAPPEAAPTPEDGPAPATEEAPAAPDAEDDAGDDAPAAVAVDVVEVAVVEVEVEDELEAVAVEVVEVVVDAAGDAPAASESDPTTEGDTTDTAPGPASADDVFARLRAEQGEGDAGPAASQPDDEPATEPAEAADDDEPAMVAAEERPFAARRAALESVEKDLARRVKRGLADEQNQVLDLLRRAKPKGVDELLPGIDDHAAQWSEVVTASLLDAAAAGADWSGGVPSSVADLADELARSLTLPLRERIDRSFAASDGNLDDVADRVRALYREWKGQRLSEAAAHYAAAAYARGVFDGVAAGAEVRWVVDPAAGPCPDCDDNVLAGAIPKGDEFPTGNPCAPAHPGCHCLVLAAEG
jgi:DivIVA domain-containing protein